MRRTSKLETESSRAKKKPSAVLASIPESSEILPDDFQRDKSAPPTDQKKPPYSALVSGSLFNKLTTEQSAGIHAGLTYSQVCNPKFGPHLIDAVNRGFRYDKLINMEPLECKRVLLAKDFKAYTSYYTTAQFMAYKNELFSIHNLEFSIMVSYPHLSYLVKRQLQKILARAINTGIITRYHYIQTETRRRELIAERQTAANDVAWLDRLLDYINEAKTLDCNKITEAFQIFCKKNFGEKRKISKVRIVRLWQKKELAFKKVHRICHQLATISVPKNKDPAQIIALFREIETVLKDSPVIDSLAIPLEILAQQDAVIYRHITAVERPNPHADVALVFTELSSEEAEQRFAHLQATYPLLRDLVTDAQAFDSQAAADHSCCIIS